jgi:hypothetical protein
MKRLLLLSSLATFTLGILAICPALPVMATDDPSAGSFDPQSVHVYEDLANHDVHLIGAPGLSCAHPIVDQVKECKELEQLILASTVRIEWNLWVKDDSDGKYSRVDRISHGTVKEGRYLVTHNHAEVLQSDARYKQFNRVSVFTSDGIPIWPKGPVDTLEVVVEDDETLVLDFGKCGDQGLFARWGISSAEFSAWDSVSLQPGTEVAQVVWNGSQAYVDWVTIDDVITERGTPRLELDSLVTSGASGGGVFWNGYHIANNWYLAMAYADDRGAIPRQYSVAALNSPQIAAQLQ